MSLDEIIKERRKDNKTNKTNTNNVKNSRARYPKRKVVKAQIRSQTAKNTTLRSPNRLSRNRPTATQVSASRGNLNRRNAMNKRRGIEPKGKISPSELNRDIKRRQARDNRKKAPLPVVKPSKKQERAALAAM